MNLNFKTPHQEVQLAISVTELASICVCWGARFDALLSAYVMTKERILVADKR